MIRIAAVVLLGAAVLGMIWRPPPSQVRSEHGSDTVSVTRSLPLRTVPRVFVPVRVQGLSLSKDDVQFALRLCIPGSRASITSLDHELRLWGRTASFESFPESRFQHSEELLETLTDARRAAQVTGFSGEFLRRSEFGLEVARAQPSGAVRLGEPHFGHLMSTFGSAGVPLTTAMVSSTGESFTVRDCLTDLCGRYSPQDEPEFFACALAHYLDPPFTWVASSGHRRTVSDILNTLLAAPPGDGVCFGGHVPFALTMLLRMDESDGCLTCGERERIHSRLQDVSWQLTRSQLATGVWLNWADRRRPMQSDSDLIDRISVTGHHLEWIAFAPDAVRPAPDVIRRAAAGLIRDLRNLTGQHLQSPVARMPLTHAARALASLSPGSVGLTPQAGDRSQ